MQNCPNCGSYLNQGYCGQCGFNQVQQNQYQQQPNYQQPPAYAPQPIYAPPPEKKSSGGSIAAAIVVVIVVIMALVLISTYILPMSGINITTGAIQVRYNSVWGGDVNIYIDGVLEDTISSDQWYTFNGIIQGSHTVSAYSLDGGFLDSSTVHVSAGETTSVQLSYL